MRKIDLQGVQIDLMTSVVVYSNFTIYFVNVERERAAVQLLSRDMLTG